MKSQHILEWVNTIGTMIFSMPVALVFGFLLFRRPIMTLLGRFTGDDVFKVKFGGILELERKLERMVEEGEKTVQGMHQLHSRASRELNQLLNHSQRRVDQLVKQQAAVEQQIKTLESKLKQLPGETARRSEEEVRMAGLQIQVDANGRKFCYERGYKYYID